MALRVAHSDHHRCQRRSNFLLHHRRESLPSRPGSQDDVPSAYGDVHPRNKESYLPGDQPETTQTTSPPGTPVRRRTSARTPRRWESLGNSQRTRRRNGAKLQPRRQQDLTNHSSARLYTTGPQTAPPRRERRQGAAADQSNGFWAFTWSGGRMCGRNRTSVAPHQVTAPQRRRRHCGQRPRISPGPSPPHLLPSHQTPTRSRHRRSAGRERGQGEGADLTFGLRRADSAAHP
jgi:hypothetical protein